MAIWCSPSVVAFSLNPLPQRKPAFLCITLFVEYEIDWTARWKFYTTDVRFSNLISNLFLYGTYRTLCDPRFGYQQLVKSRTPVVVVELFISLQYNSYSTVCYSTCLATHLSSEFSPCFLHSLPTRQFPWTESWRMLSFFSNFRGFHEDLLNQT